MKIVILFAVLSVALAYEYTQEKYEKLDVEGVIKNGPQLKAFVVCFTDDSTCDQFTGSFNDDFKEVVRTACAECNPLVKHVVKRFLESSAQQFPAEVGKLLETLDPQKMYIAPLKAAVANF